MSDYETHVGTATKVKLKEGETYSQYVINILYDKHPKELQDWKEYYDTILNVLKTSTIKNITTTPKQKHFINWTM